MRGHLNGHGAQDDEQDYQKIYFRQLTGGLYPPGASSKGSTCSRCSSSSRSSASPTRAFNPASTSGWRANVAVCAAVLCSCAATAPRRSNPFVTRRAPAVQIMRHCDSGLVYLIVFFGYPTRTPCHEGPPVGLSTPGGHQAARCGRATGRHSCKLCY